MQSRRPATFADADAVKRTVQGIEGIKQGFGFGDAILAPEALGQAVQGLDRALDVGGAGRLFRGWQTLWHSLDILQKMAQSRRATDATPTHQPRLGSFQSGRMKWQV